MKLLWQELKRHKKVIFVALTLATLNQVFSLLDPLIFRSIIDNYAAKASDFGVSEFIRGVGFLLLLSVGAAFISRTAKAFQNYYVSVITQRSGTNLYSRSVSHAFSLPYAVFEDQRSGEILLKMQKARSDSQLFIGNVINILFLSHQHNFCIGLCLFGPLAHRTSIRVNFTDSGFCCLFLEQEDKRSSANDSG